MCPVEPITPSPRSEGYRNKAQFVYKREGKRILSDFKTYLPLFKKVIPHDYRLVTEAIEQNERDGMSAEESKIEAFYQLIHSR